MNATAIYINSLRTILFILVSWADMTLTSWVRIGIMSQSESEILLCPVDGDICLSQQRQNNNSKNKKT